MAIERAKKQSKRKVLYTEREVAQMGFKSAKSLRNDRYKGVGIPYIRIGPHSIRYHRHDLITHLRTHRIETGNLEQ